jgi:hypothetical protein
MTHEKPFNIKDAAKRFSYQPYGQQKQPIEAYLANRSDRPDFQIIVYGVANDGHRDVLLSVMKHQNGESEDFVQVILKVDSEKNVIGIGGEGVMKVWFHRPGEEDPVALTYRPTGNGTEAVAESQAVEWKRACHRELIG